jgi:outer membrane murein-binding lipoprotein Lpp
MNKKPESIAITEQTLIPVSLLVVIISALVLGVIHVQTISAKADSTSTQVSANTAEIKTIKADQNALTLEVVTRLARIEGALGLPEYKRDKK